MKRRFLWQGCTVALLLFCWGCGPGDKIAAVVNGAVITASEVDRRMAGLTPNARAALGNDRGRLLEQMIMERILIQEARRRRLEREPQVRDLFEAAQRQILVGRLLEALEAETPSQVNDQELAQFYNTHRSQFQKPETFRASHLLVKEEVTAQQALERLNKGEPFAEVAAELSLDPSKDRGGDIGPFTAGQIIPEFEAACRQLAPGQMSGVVKTPLGYHVILLTERHPQRQLALEEVEDQLRVQILAERRQRHVEEQVQALRQKAEIQVQDPALAASSAFLSGDVPRLSRSFRPEESREARNGASSPPAAHAAESATPKEAPPAS